MEGQGIREFIEAGKESRHLEYKESVSWNGPSIRMKIIKAILGMANTQDGGVIVVGMERQVDNSYIPKGVTAEHLATFQDEDAIKDVVSNHADPYVEFDLRIDEYDGKKFVIFSINEFTELPVICKEQYPHILKRGVIYIRSRRKPETIEIPTQAEMRELIELAIDKGNRKLEKRGYKLSVKVNDEVQYQQQLEDFT